VESGSERRGRPDDRVSSISLLSAVFTDTLASNEEALVSAVADLGLAPNSGT
jgi:hypothetical protein